MSRDRVASTNWTDARPLPGIGPPKTERTGRNRCGRTGHRAADPAPAAVGLPPRRSCGARCLKRVRAPVAGSPRRPGGPENLGFGAHPTARPKVPSAHLGRAVEPPGARTRPRPAAPRDSRRRDPGAGGSRKAAPAPCRGHRRGEQTPARDSSEDLAPPRGRVAAPKPRTRPQPGTRPHPRWRMGSFGQPAAKPRARPQSRTQP